MTDALRLTDLHRRFGKVQALDGLCLTVPQGEIYGFLGRNGAGKTTTLLVLMGILRPDSGEVSFFGETVRKVGVAQKRRIGYVSQEQNFYPWMTPLQLGSFVSGFYPRWDGAEFKRLLKTLDVPADRRAAELSGGTRAKLGLALALAPSPDLLLLDEPTAGLDPVARREFNDLLVERVREKGCTALFSSHIVDEVEHVATRIGIVQAGKMRFEGPLSELLGSLRRVQLPKAEIPLPSPLPSPEPATSPEQAQGPAAPIEQVQGEAAPPTSTSIVEASPTEAVLPVEAPAAPAPAAPPALPMPPPGFARLRGDVWQASPGAWLAAPGLWPEGTAFSSIDLEDAFLAFARTGTETVA
ncbi:MAG TPA: ABC transporter ATP-binding protein [Myxococcales bacterium]|jgi:ABC-2 type transport system ATP-binding protein